MTIPIALSNAGLDRLDPDKRDNPTCKNFLENKEVQRTIFPRGKAKVLNRTGRAICRIMSRNATKCWSVGDIGYIFGVSHTSVRRAIDNVFKPPDNVDEDYEHAGDPAFKIEFPPLPEPPTLRNAHRETQVRAGIHIGASNFSHPQSMSPVNGQDSSNSSKAEVFSTTGLDVGSSDFTYLVPTFPDSARRNERSTNGSPNLNHLPLTTAAAKKTLLRRRPKRNDPTPNIRARTRNLIWGDLPLRR
ncbi:hypothetical protein C8F01DRAFT_269220 [Mycena amicta]|nr:hypothetical protein C8F01DRAFT_269220 [Mycena amicta]